MSSTPSRRQWGPRLLLFLLLAPLLPATESWILPLDSPLYQPIEEFFLNNRRLPPLEETPVVAEEARQEIAKTLSLASAAKISQGQSLLEQLRQPIHPLSPIVELGFRGYGGNREPREHFIDIPDQKTMLHYLPLYELYRIPPPLKLGFIASFSGISLLFQPELREGLQSHLSEQGYTNIPNSFARLNLSDVDSNIPYRGIVSLFRPPVELRVGRDKLQLGPGRISALAVGKQMPYFDYIKARVFGDWFSYSWYLIRLNPIMERDETDELAKLGTGDFSNPEIMARVEAPFSDRTKHLAVHKFFIKPLPWLSLGLAELNMIGGRHPQLTDMNPLTILHNNYSEGNTNQTMSLTLNLVPYAGILLYGEFFLYENVLPTESKSGYKPSARAWQVGLTLLSDPFLETGPGRIRLDSELSMVDPWCYNRWYDLKKYTSRMVYNTSRGRYWIDYPLGFYLGPDAVQYFLNLSYGIPESWEIALSWLHWGKGSLYLYGWGEQSSYPTLEEPELGRTLTKAPTAYDGKEVFWSDALKLSAQYFPFRNLQVAAWFRLKLVKNEYNEPGRNRRYWQIGTDVIWKLF